MITGVSGSGKSSLAFDTIYAEGQRRYVESLSAYARQFLERMEKPEVDDIDGIAPAIAIRQKNTSRNPRSTVATSTECYDFLRLLYARVGQTFCPNCGTRVRARHRGRGGRAAAGAAPRLALVCAVPGEPGAHSNTEALRDHLFELRKKGFNRLFQDGRMFEFSTPESLLDIDFSQAAVRAGGPHRDRPRPASAPGGYRRDLLSRGGRSDLRKRWPGRRSGCASTRNSSARRAAWSSPSRSRVCSASTARSAPARAARASATPSISTWIA